MYGASHGFMSSFLKVINDTNVMPLFHRRTKTRSCLGPLNVDSRCKKGKMGGKIESVLKPGIKYRLVQIPNWSATKNRLSQFSGRFEA